MLLLNTRGKVNAGVLYGVIAFLVVLLLVVSFLLIRKNHEKTQTAAETGEIAVSASLPQPQASAATFDPVDEMERFQTRMNQFLNTVQMHGRPFLKEMGIMGEIDFFPPGDLSETESAYKIALDLPGLERDKIEVKVQGQTVTIRGERLAQSSTTSTNGSFYSQERQYGKFSRMIPLPGPVLDAGVSASYENGVLTVTLPKDKKAEVTKSIPVS